MWSSSRRRRIGRFGEDMSISDTLFGSEAGQQEAAAKEITPPATETPPAAAETKGEEASAPPAPSEAKESGKEGSTDPGAETKSTPEAEKVASGQYGALKDERRKRQDLERRVEELTARVSAGQPGQPAEAPRAPDFLDNPEQYIAREIGAVKLQMSESMVQAQHPDYTEVINAFADMANETPGLWGQMNAHANPAEFAYKTGKLYSETRDLGDLGEWKDAQRKSIREEVIAELKAESALAEASGVAKTTAGARGSGATGAAAVSSGDMGIIDVLGL